MEFELRGTLAIVSGQIQAELSDDHRVVIDLSDWDSTFDDEQETGPEDGREGTNVSNVAVVDGNEDIADPLEIPGPYQMTPPDMDELPEYWYVVDHGTEVGIFDNSESADRAVAGVVGGHQVRVKSWFEAVSLYNVLHRQGNIFCVHA